MKRAIGLLLATALRRRPAPRAPSSRTRRRRCPAPGRRRRARRTRPIRNPSRCRATTPRTIASPSGGTTPATSATPSTLRYGFEFVVFRAERGGFPVTWASHVALTNQTDGTFHYAQRSEIGPQVDRSAPHSGFALALLGRDPQQPGTLERVPWMMTGAGGADRLSLDVAEDEVEGDPLPGGFGLSFDLVSDKPAALHDQDGYIDFGPGRWLVLLLAHARCVRRARDASRACGRGRATSGSITSGATSSRWAAAAGTGSR